MMRLKRVFLGLLFVTVFVMLMPGQVMATEGTSGSLEVTEVAFDDMSVTVRAYDLTEDSDYAIISSPDGFTTNTTEVNFTASSTSHTFFFSTSGVTLTGKTIEYCLTGKIGQESFAAAVVYFPDTDDVVNSDALIDFIITIVVIVLPVLIVRRLMRGF